ISHAVYYIKKQAQLGTDTYYLISTEPSSERGVVGWVKSTDMSTHPHTVVDKHDKVYYIKGTGKATTKAWGGKKDAVYPSLSSYKNKEFKVHLTEKVGNATWYRGVLEGKTVWLHSSDVYSANKSSTSRLGHLNSVNVDIYESIGGKSFKAGTTYTHAVYYIKEQAQVRDEIYYLISTAPSSDRGVVGWVKSTDMSTHSHTVVDKKTKTFYVRGT